MVKENRLKFILPLHMWTLLNGAERNYILWTEEQKK